MNYYPIVACLFLVLFIGCNEVDPKGEKEVHSFVTQWNANHTQVKAHYLQRDYMDVVEYYGKERTKEEVARDKLELFEQFPAYSQTIQNNQLTITKEGGTYLVVFTKLVQYNGLEEAYESYLSLVLKNGNYKIIREGVAVDSKNQNAAIFPNYRELFIDKTRNRQLFGDFNGDGLSDYAYVSSPELRSTTDTKTTEKDTLCIDKCTSIINFSASNLATIPIENAHTSQLENLKDLNGDGADEIGFWNIKSTTKSLYIIDATTGILLTSPVTINTAVHKNLSLIDVIKKSGRNKITVTRSEEQNGKWVLVSEVVVLD